MGIVKISDLMHENLRLASGALDRSINSQAEHWLKIGMLAELYPHLSHQQLSRLLVTAQLSDGCDITKLLGQELAAAAEE
ncbi:hypothetical protein BTJ39_02880 [Izhakiella australiensis]|uniref:ParD-like family protein n=1 Tax=Izhakiella australiensis TaxID=1926881 RepID=A0A1S8YSP8_9GAMM|nr:ParD-like family protein [Izhakiella australiensis]OON42114.1 hypothetical protein BTJ39_02880 [Izhakiella australiensis]